MAQLEEIKREDIKDQERELIPNGKYRAVVVDSDVRLTKKAKEANDPSRGQYIYLELQLLDDPYKNRIVFDRINIINENETAVEIGRRTMAQLMDSIGLSTINDTQALHMKPFIVEVGTESSEQYEPSNVVKKYLPATQKNKSSVAPAQSGDPSIRF